MSNPQSPFFSFRNTRRSAVETEQSPLLRNSLRAETLADVEEFACDPSSLLDEQKQPALSSSANYRSLKAATNDLLSADDGSQELRHVRELEQFYVNELREELEKNRVNNLTIRQKEDIYERAQKRFQRLIIDNSLNAYRMTEDLPLVLEQFKQVFGEQQRRREENYESVRQRHKQLEEEMQKTVLEAQSSVRKSQELRQLLIQEHFERWQAEALEKGEEVSLKYDKAEKRIQQLERERERLVECSVVGLEKEQQETADKRQILEREYQLALEDRQRCYNELAERIFNGRSQLFDEFVAEKSSDNERKRIVKDRKEHLEAEETVYKAEKFVDKFSRSEKHLFQIKDNEQQLSEAKRELLEQEIERSREELRIQAEARIQKRDEMVEADEQAQARRLRDEVQTQREIQRQSDVEHYKKLFINESRSVGLPQIAADRLPPNLRQITPGESILNMPREEAMKRIAEYEESCMEQYTPAVLTHRLGSSGGSRGRSRSSGRISDTQRIQTMRRVYTPKAAQPNIPGGVSDEKRRNNDIMLGILENERQREAERAEELAASPEQSHVEIQEQHEHEREETEAELQELQEKYEAIDVE